jgi:hypothetical protein
MADDRALLTLKGFFSVDAKLVFLPERGGVRLSQLAGSVPRITQRSLAVHWAISGSLLDGLLEDTRGSLRRFIVLVKV